MADLRRGWCVCLAQTRWIQIMSSQLCALELSSPPPNRLRHHPAVCTGEMWSSLGCGGDRSGCLLWCSLQLICPTSLLWGHPALRSRAPLGLMGVLAQLQKSPPLDQSVEKLFLGVYGREFPIHRAVLCWSAEAHPVPPGEMLCRLWRWLAGWPIDRVPPFSGNGSQEKMVRCFLDWQCSTAKRDRLEQPRCVSNCLAQLSQKRTLWGWGTGCLQAVLGRLLRAGPGGRRAGRADPPLPVVVFIIDFLMENLCCFASDGLQVNLSKSSPFLLNIFGVTQHKNYD